MHAPRRSLADRDPRDDRGLASAERPDSTRWFALAAIVLAAFAIGIAATRAVGAAWGSLVVVAVLVAVAIACWALAASRGAARGRMRPPEA